MMSTSHIIWENFEYRRQKNPKFSLRSYANYLKISPASLSGFFSGKRSLSSETLTKIADRLNLSPHQRASVLNAPSMKTSLIDEQTFSLISEWQYFAILNLIEMNDFKGNPRWIAKRLGIANELAEVSWDRLKSMGFIKSKDGRWVRTKHRVHTIDQVSSLAIRRSHLDDLDLIREAILSEDLSRRDNTSLTFPLNAREIQKVIELVRSFRSEIVSAAEKTGDYTDVYKLCIHLIPLTKHEKAKKNENN